jgi:hypothetical protein
LSRAKRLAGISAVSPCMRVTLMPGVADLNGIGRIGARANRAASVVCALRAC